jgi:hypothetical protein
VRQQDALVSAEARCATEAVRCVVEGSTHPTKLHVIWEGDVQGLHFLAIVNRALCGGLLDRAHDLRRSREQEVG